MPTTANKGYSVQTTGSNSGTWGDNLNDDMIAIVDNNMGGIVTKSVSSSNIVLSATESQMAIVRLTGTLLANIQLTTSCVGFTIVENLCSGTSFGITMTNGVAGVLLPFGRCMVISDTTNGCRISATDSLPVGTRMSFQQSFAPTGWTKDPSIDDKAIRITSGAASSGGSLPFTTCFAASRSIGGATAGYALQISDIPPHTHTTSIFNGGAQGGSGKAVLSVDPAGTSNWVSSSVGGGGSHAHGAGSLNIQMNVAYVDMILAVKN